MRGRHVPLQKQEKTLLFLKKKKQKDFYVFAAPKIEAMAGILPHAPEIKVFCFFFSKKKFFLSYFTGAGFCSRA